MSEKIKYVYALIDPRDDKIEYVGCTCNLKNRYNKHMHEGKQNDTTKNQWLADLFNYNLKPIMKVLEECNYENWESTEKNGLNFLEWKI